VIDTSVITFLSPFFLDETGRVLPLLTFIDFCFPKNT
jgi:hypothetical protein